MTPKTTTKPIIIFTDEEKQQIERAAHRVLDVIAADLLAVTQEYEHRDYLKQAEVIELVIDATRLVDIGKIPAELNARLYAMDHKALYKWFRQIFPFKRYS